MVTWKVVQCTKLMLTLLCHFCILWSVCFICKTFYLKTRKEKRDHGCIAGGCCLWHLLCCRLWMRQELAWREEWSWNISSWKSHWRNIFLNISSRRVCTILCNSLSLTLFMVLLILRAQHVILRSVKKVLKSIHGLRQFEVVFWITMAFQGEGKARDKPKWPSEVMW